MNKMPVLKRVVGRRFVNEKWSWDWAQTVSVGHIGDDGVMRICHYRSNRWTGRRSATLVVKEVF